MEKQHVRALVEAHRPMIEDRARQERTADLERHRRLGLPFIGHSTVLGVDLAEGWLWLQVEVDVVPMPIQVLGWKAADAGYWHVEEPLTKRV